MTSRATWTGPARHGGRRRRGASLILFPEMFLTGYLIRDQLAQLAEPYPNGPALTVLGQKAKALSLGVVMGMPLANPGGKPYNAVVMIDRDGTPAGFQAKTHFFGGEEKMFAPGTSLRAFDTSFGRMGILVCYDGEFPETARSLALDGAKLICMCAANMSPYEDYHFLYMRTPGPWRTARIPSTATMSEMKSGSTTAARAEPSTPPGSSGGGRHPGGDHPLCPHRYGGHHMSRFCIMIGMVNLNICL